MDTQFVLYPQYPFLKVTQYYANKPPQPSISNTTDHASSPGYPSSVGCCPRGPFYHISPRTVKELIHLNNVGTVQQRPQLKPKVSTNKHMNSIKSPSHGPQRQFSYGLALLACGYLLLLCMPPLQPFSFLQILCR